MTAMHQTDQHDHPHRLGDGSPRPVSAASDRGSRDGIAPNPPVGDAAPTVLLFYRDFEYDTYFKNDRYLKRVVKPLYDRFRSGPKVSGFLVWFRLLVKALRSVGCDVRIDDYAFARRHPYYPVGLVGYPAILDGWNLPNPAILGPGLFDHPLIAPRLMDDPRFRGYVATCDWIHEMFAPIYGEDCLIDWHAGIDLAEWPDGASHAKSIDVLLYDKVRWDRDRYEPEMIAPIGRYLADERGLTVRTVRYGAYDHAEYRQLLQSARSLVFSMRARNAGHGLSGSPGVERAGAGLGQRLLARPESPSMGPKSYSRDLGSLLRRHLRKAVQ